MEANEISLENVAGAFRGQLLIATAAVVSFLSLMYVSNRLVGGATKRKIVQGSFAIALMIAIGIGLHNLGEGLAIVAPMAKERPKISYLAALGFIAGAPAIAGT